MERDVLEELSEFSASPWSGAREFRNRVMLFKATLEIHRLREENEELRTQLRNAGEIACIKVNRADGEED